MKFYLAPLFTCFFLIACFSQQEKSSIKIIDPVQGTVWNIPEKVSLEWKTGNIDASKSIRFFLVRNEMVVQELGSFKNTGTASDIELAKNIGSGDKYQVVGIELFPDDKYQIAKFVTPFFSIVNKASDERKKIHALTQVEKADQSSIKKKPKKKKVRREKDGVAVVTKTITEAPTSTIRQEFEGRKISYTKELSFDNEEITVKIWDHGRQDGDIVSIYLNGNSVVNKHYLTYWKREFKMVLNTNKSNDLFLYAHNLGDSPPNTVAIEISDGSKSENIVLNSDLKSCEAVMISVNK
ncbi:hypothetical protein ACOCEA_02580 [Maribacter sp. CXY002]|uniref:hypothetical protein n=1 Tax=Maribacter luteocoastalis TaxID=3407671 RepID=UPI003B66BBA1